MLYERHLKAPGPILAKLDLVSTDGMAEGWAMYRDSAAICHIQIRLKDRILGEDMADKFRPDLLQAGLGHGYCAFYASIGDLPPGTYKLHLHDGRTGARISPDDAPSHTVPLRNPLQPATVEALLRAKARWSDEDILAHPECLQLDENLAILGPDRFVDRVFRFTLGRWADTDGGGHYADMLRRGEMSAALVLTVVLSSAERLAQDRPLARPMDPDYPFIIVPPQRRSPGRLTRAQLTDMPTPGLVAVSSIYSSQSGVSGNTSEFRKHTNSPRTCRRPILLAGP
jgi:hypothetical protein